MTAEIISVGTELLLGNILNTNAQYLSVSYTHLDVYKRQAKRMPRMAPCSTK